MMEEGSSVIKFLRLPPDSKLPVRGSERAAGLDLCSVEAVSIGSGRRIAVRTGLAVAIPTGYYGRVAPRSGLAVEQRIVAVAGVIDSEFTGVNIRPLAKP